MDPDSVQSTWQEIRQLLDFHQVALQECLQDHMTCQETSMNELLAQQRRAQAVLEEITAGLGLPRKDNLRKDSQLSRDSATKSSQPAPSNGHTVRYNFASSTGELDKDKKGEPEKRKKPAWIMFSADSRSSLPEFKEVIRRIKRKQHGLEPGMSQSQSDLHLDKAVLCGKTGSFDESCELDGVMASTEPSSREREDPRKTAKRASTLSSLFDHSAADRRLDRVRRSSVMSMNSNSSQMKLKVVTKWSAARESVANVMENVAESRLMQRPVACGDRVLRFIRRWVQIQAFDVFCAVVMILNAVLVGMEIEYMTTHHESNRLFFLAQFLFNLWYIVELFLRIVADGWDFFSLQDAKWNMFDACLVATSLVDMCAAGLDGTGLQFDRVFRVIRLFRIVRTLRIVRVLQWSIEFRKMLYSLAASAQTLLWSLVMLSFILYSFGIWFTDAVTDHLRHDFDLELNEYYGSLFLSIYTLYMAITTGHNWGELVIPLKRVSWWVVGLFVMYMSVSLLGVLNVVTSVFVESAMQSSQHYKDLMVQEKLRTKEVFIRHIRNIFRQIDTDHSGSISMEELKDFIEDEELQLQTYFEALELNPSDTKSLFKLLDHNNNGCIDIDEFCDGCLKLKGEARSFDVNCMMYENKRLERRMTHFMDDTRTQLDSLDTNVDKALRKILTSIARSNTRAGAGKRQATTQELLSKPPPERPLSDDGIHEEEKVCQFGSSSLSEESSFCLASQGDVEDDPPDLSPPDERTPGDFSRSSFRL